MATHAFLARSSVAERLDRFRKRPRHERERSHNSPEIIPQNRAIDPQTRLHYNVD